MNQRKTILSASILTALLLSGPALAQDNGTAQGAQQNDAQSTSSQRAAKKHIQELQAVTVVGIRDSEAESLNLKRDSNAQMEVVTAEDIGKLPAKNVADTLQRLPGVNISTSSAGEGGFDESDRVSLRGTAPSMTQTLINGHNVGTGDWFVLNQTATVGRSVSYSLLPSEIVSEVKVYKSSEAKLVEGGSAGTVDIITRKPLEYSKPFTAQASIGGVYADLPGKTKPQFSGMFNWKNDDNTFGVMAQAFYEERSLQRNGQEILGLNQLQATDPIVMAHPDLNGVYYPSLLGAVYFTQERKRKGGSVDIQWKAADNLTFNLNGFYSKLEANNYNRNYMIWGNHFVPGATNLNPGYIVQNNTLTQASFAPSADGTNYGIYDMIARKASSQTQYLTLDADWNVNDNLAFNFQVGTTTGKGNSPRQDVLEMNTSPNTGAAWGFRGTGQPANWMLGSDNSSPAASGATANWIFGEGGIHTKDKENWGKIDGSLYYDDGTLSSLDFGVRYADHTRENPSAFAQGAAAGFADPANFPQGFQHYPGDFGSSLGGSFPTNIWYYSASDLAAYDAKYASRGPDRLYPNDIYKVNEKDSAAYLQANFQGDNWSGNLGVRYVHTKEAIGYSSNTPQEDKVVGPIMGSAFFPTGWYFNTYDHSYGKFLPSANLKINVADNLLARFAASQTLTRPDYSAMAGTVSLDDLGHTGSGGNPKLKPLLATNVSAALEWYFAPRGLLSASVFRMNLKNYVNFSHQNRTYKDMQASQNGPDVYSTYDVSIPSNTDGKVKGVELNYQQPIGKYFGMAMNYTYASGHASNDEPLQGTSKKTGNASAYFENDKFNARISYTYRSSYYAGPDRGGFFYMAGTGYLSMSLGYNVNEWMSLSLDAMNLNNPTLRYYVKGDDYGVQPRSFYTNGRQYYLTARFKF
ncbi:TonB-dependent receptor [Oleiagrimonas soli]|uniref:Iron complex outermembrane receptor protein n=1 Tax=Oleiagrimonas soli TaxID=1543381 RepID=A0A099CV82_9GAMM|nr:TonB-dependent receptor [Oleiagrimonas soli]KGI77571.1 TonB-dependent receptor [Oleiagrimonas soli]MBB6182945.1 iron complex outermembrane receptor protein [Oleiagrimonas soli]